MFQKPVKKQIVLPSLPVVITAVLIIGLSTYLLETSNIKKGASFLTQSMVGQISILLNDEMMTVLTQMINLPGNPVINTFSFSESSSEGDFSSLIVYYSSVEEIHRNYDQTIGSLYFYNDHGTEVKCFVSDVSKHIGFSLTQRMKECNASSYEIHRLSDHRNDVSQTTTPYRVISVFRIIGLPQSASSEIILSNLNSSYFSGVLDSVHVSKNGYMILISKDGTLQSAAMQNWYYLTLSVVEKPKGHFGSSGSTALHSMTNRRMIVIYQSIEVSG